MEKYLYKNTWGDIPALHSVCTLLQSHTARTAVAAVELGYFFDTFATDHAADVTRARQLNAQIAAAEAAGDAAQLEHLQQEKKRLKTAAPCIIPAAFYPGTHTADSPRTPTNIMCIDIDRKDNPQITRAEWGALPLDLLRSKMGKYVLFVGESRSGWERGGYFVLLRLTAADDFPARFAAVEKWMSAAGVKIDRAAKNINHCRALTIQDNSTRSGFCSLPIVNPDAQPYPGMYHEPRPRPKVYTGDRATDYERARKACNYIERHGINLADDFETWTRLAFAFAAAFGEAGEGLFLQCASASDKFRTTENTRKYRNALQTNTGRVNIATFWHLCRQAGLNTKDF